MLVAVTHAGICGTDRHIYEWDAWSQSRVKVGITTGHEFVGRVVAVGIAPSRAPPSASASAPRGTSAAACASPAAPATATSAKRSIFWASTRDGCFAQFVAVPEENVWPVHPDIPDKIAAIFDPLGNAMHTVMAAGVSGRSVLITGVGIIGLMAVTIARAAGAGKILVTDVSPRRLELAKQLGADVAFDSQRRRLAAARPASSRTTKAPKSSWK